MTSPYLPLLVKERAGIFFNKCKITLDSISPFSFFILIEDEN